MAGGPLGGSALLVAAAQGSVPAERVPDLVDIADEYLLDRLETYRRRYECVHEDTDHVVFFVEEGHWAALGEEIGLEKREANAVRRAHAEHIKRVGEEGRREEFETALEVREAVAISKETA